MEPGGDSDTPSFWFQPPTNNRRRPQLVNPVVLILAIPIFTLLVLFFLVPPFLSHTNQILRPNSVKKSWDSLNILLVLFAILCGVFARRNDEAPPSDDTDNRRLGSVSSLGNKPRQSAAAWLDFPDRKEYNDNVIHGDVGSSGGGLRRSSSSYPDLRQESIWENGNRFKFVDDFEVNFYRSPPPPDNFESRPRRRSHEGLRGEAETLVKEIPVDKFEARPAPVDKFEVRSTPGPPKSTAPPPPPPPSASAANLKRRRSVHSVLRKENGERHRNHESEVASENQRPVPPPPAVEPEFQLPEVISEKVRRKKSGATKEIATAIASLYKGQRKRKKRGKSRNIYESAAPQSSSPPQSAAPPPAPPPPPPPPPPPSKVLQNLFKKSTKSKRVHSVPTAAPLPPPPPPLPPPNSIFNNLFKTTGTKSKRFLQSSTTPPPPPLPPLPPSSILNSLFNNGSKSRRLKNTITSPPPPPPPPPGPSRSRQLNNGRPPNPTKPTPQDHENAFVAPPSPLIPLPPPPPPFRMSRARFVARGDFVRIRSAHSSRCSSPELEDVDDIVSVKDGGPSVSCPSPDVNVKADTFIARLRDEWRLEKVNSIKEKRTSG